jgi:hypothetical protein
MREYKTSESITPGCVRIHNIYQEGDYNIFVRESSGKRLAHMIGNREKIDVSKIIIDLAEILKNLHEDNIRK